MQTKSKQWDNFHRDHHVCEKFMFCDKFWDCGTPNKLALQEINTPSKHPSNLVVCHAFFVGFFARRICDDGWHFVDFHARVGCDHPHHKLAKTPIYFKVFSALDSTKNVGGWIVISCYFPTHSEVTQGFFGTSNCIICSSSIFNFSTT